jgi:hypothetical protein
MTFVYDLKTIAPDHDNDFRFKSLDRTNEWILRKEFLGHGNTQLEPRHQDGPSAS